ncbi:MAG TPA: hypothetical protein VFV63_05440 [Ilumatobacteraceae bacterium]|nr:hypothetical protein [Ilumatobacteraceae bacterium]
MDNHRGAVSLVLAGLIGLTGAACADDGSKTTTRGTTQDASSTVAAGDTTAGDPGSTVPAPSTPDDSTPALNTSDDKAPSATSGTAPVDTGPPQGSSDTVYPRGEIDTGLQPFITMAVDDLAARLGIDASEITPLSGVLVVWPNGALGCPRPGMQYTQVPVDGSVIELGAGGRVYRYHTGGSTPPFLCDQPLTEKPSSGDIGD